MPRKAKQSQIHKLQHQMHNQPRLHRQKHHNRLCKRSKVLARSSSFRRRHRKPRPRRPQKVIMQLKLRLLSLRIRRRPPLSRSSKPAKPSLKKAQMNKFEHSKQNPPRKRKRRQSSRMHMKLRVRNSLMCKMRTSKRNRGK